MWAGLNKVFIDFLLEIWWSSQCYTETAAGHTTPIYFSLFASVQESGSAPSVPKDWAGMSVDVKSSGREIQHEVTWYPLYATKII